jgi:hypothetical protein
MNKKSKFVLYSFIILTSLLLIEGVYIYSNKIVTNDVLNSKLAFVELTGLPDLAISTEVSYVRHRSMTTPFSIYSDDGVLREYASSTFVYSHSHIKDRDEF